MQSFKGFADWTTLHVVFAGNPCDHQDPAPRFQIHVIKTLSKKSEPIKLLIPENKQKQCFQRGNTVCIGRYWTNFLSIKQVPYSDFFSTGGTSQLWELSRFIYYNDAICSIIQDHEMKLR